MGVRVVLSVFPGIDLLGRGFELEGFCVVRGPDLIWGGDVRDFHVPAGVFDGVIGGPPCQLFSRMRHLNPLAGQKHGNLIPEFERIVREARPRWFVMENVEDAPQPQIDGYPVHAMMMNPRWLGAEQNRERRFSSNLPLQAHVEVAIFESPIVELAVTATSARAVPVKIGGGGKVKRTWKPPTITGGHGAPFGAERGTERTIEEMCELQGLPRTFTDEMPFTAQGKRKVIGNGVPIPMARAVAKAVKRSLEAHEHERS